MTKPRKKTRIEDIRREELIQAAHRVFLAHGMAGLTTARICAEAGMSPGILAYYFRGKEHVLFEMVRYNNRILMEEIVARLRQARTGWDRLLAIIEGNFPERAYHRAQASAWVSVCSAGGANPEYARLQRTYNRRLASNVASALRGKVSQERARPLILMIGVMIDGLWLRKAVDEPITRDEAVGLILAQVSVTLGPDVVEELRQGL
ncbi:transcriptional regulator BetI [Tabrizicola oligotrophica]|uniref:Transcriptional regulator BetI n=1 Tax=Tabrizicola oligotrophica TaxID=2710650 RepID=A0A6M0QZ95_9RHOB|nr:transcriptional regulator BetI [Tabrizicola oligotrophica]NEY91792.1 transcriptional regulator BetI [Tabrizicola oligotrophica]